MRKNFTISYDYNAPEYKELRERYNLQEMAKGTDFEKCQSLLVWVSRKIRHRGNYDNSDRQDALTLLALSYQTDYGINCLSLSIVLCECLLAVGIKARVVYMMPEAAEDGDNHVVVEAFVSEWNKWIVLDATYGSYCIGEDDTILNLGELQAYVASGKKYYFSKGINYNGETNLDLQDIRTYYAKNLFFLRCKSIQGYGAHREYGHMMEIAPRGFDVHERMVQNLQYRIATYGECDIFEKWFAYESNLENVYIDRKDFWEEDD